MALRTLRLKSISWHSHILQMQCFPKWTKYALTQIVSIFLGLTSTQEGKRSWSFSIIKIKGFNGWNDNVNEIKSFFKIDMCSCMNVVLNAFNRAPFFLFYPLNMLEYNMYVSLWCCFSFSSIHFFFIHFIVSLFCPRCLFHLFSFWISINKRLVLICQAYEFYYGWEEKKNRSEPASGRTATNIFKGSMHIEHTLWFLYVLRCALGCC